MVVHCIFLQIESYESSRSVYVCFHILGRSMVCINIWDCGFHTIMTWISMFYVARELIFIHEAKQFTIARLKVWSILCANDHTDRVIKLLIIRISMDLLFLWRNKAYYHCAIRNDARILAQPVVQSVLPLCNSIWSVGSDLRCHHVHQVHHGRALHFLANWILRII